MQFGRYYEEFEVGAVYKHWPGKTVTEYDDHLFCLLTMNHHPLHLDANYAATTQQGRNVVVGNYVYSLLLGMSVADVSGRAIANLEVESLKHVFPTFHGDTIYGQTEVLDKTECKSKDDRGRRPRRDQGLQPGRRPGLHLPPQGDGPQAQSTPTRPAASSRAARSCRSQRLTGGDRHHPRRAVGRRGRRGYRSGHDPRPDRRRGHARRRRRRGGRRLPPRGPAATVVERPARRTVVERPVVERRSSARSIVERVAGWSPALDRRRLRRRTVAAVSVPSTCPRCGAALRAPGLMDSAWQCERHGAVTPLRVLPQAIADTLRQAAASARRPGVVAAPAAAGLDGHRARDRRAPSARARPRSPSRCPGPSPLGGPADLVLVAEEPGTGLGARYAGLDAARPGRRRRGRPRREGRGRRPRHPAVALRRRPTDRCAFVGEAVRRVAVGGAVAAGRRARPARARRPARPAPRGPRQRGPAVRARRPPGWPPLAVEPRAPSGR